MDRWLLPHSRDYGEITCYTSALDRFDQTTTAWWKSFKYDMHQKGQTFTRSWEELKRLMRQHFVLANYMVKKVGQDTTTVVTSADMKVVVSKDVVGQAEPLNDLNMQLKRVYGDACMPADRCQHWNLFQAQCMIKGKACKFMTDSGSYCNGIMMGQTCPIFR
jgi:hypothetical protein